MYKSQILVKITLSGKTIQHMLKVELDEATTADQKDQVISEAVRNWIDKAKVEFEEQN